MKRNLVTGLSILVLLALVIGVVGCSTKTVTSTAVSTTTATKTTTSIQSTTVTSTTVSTTQVAPKILNVGLVSPLSGPLSVYGIPWINICVEDGENINTSTGITVGGQRYNVHLVQIDDKGTSQGGLDAATQLNNAGVKFILGSIGSSPNVAMETVTDPNNILILGGGQSTALVGPSHPLYFGISGDAVQQNVAVYAWLQKGYPNAKKVAILSTNDAFGTSLSAALQKWHKILGLTTGDVEMVDPTTQDFYSVLTKMIATNPDAIDTCGAASGTQALIAKQARELGYKGVLMGSAAPIDPTSFVQIAGAAGSEGYICQNFDYKDPQMPQACRDFAADYLKRWGGNFQSTIIGYGYPVSLLKTAIETANSLDPVKVAAALQDIKWMKPFGQCQFTGDASWWYGIKRRGVDPVFASEIHSGALQLKYIVSSDQVVQLAQQWWQTK